MVAARRTADPAVARELIRQDGAAILTGLDTSSAAGVSELGWAVFGAATAVQAPIHVGTNNMGFRGGQELGNSDLRPAHTDAINDYACGLRSE